MGEWLSAVLVGFTDNFLAESRHYQELSTGKLPDLRVVEGRGDTTSPSPPAPPPTFFFFFVSARVFGRDPSAFKFCFKEICSDSEAGSYLRLKDFVYYSTLGLRVIKKKKKL